MSGGAPPITPPANLRASHDVTAFDSGVPVLDDWLKKRALANEVSGASRTYVVCEAERVIGYYAIATGAVTHQQAPGKVRRSMPEPVPAMVLGRLAVDKRHRGRGIGVGLLRDAVLRTIQAAGIAGIRAILVHATSDDAKRFYERNGFSPSPVDPMTLMITVADAERLLNRPS
jgi:GNAT superfamily N-acetyltransferase